MARSDRAGMGAGLLFFLLCALCALTGAAACAPRIPLEKLGCPCLGAEGFVCCETEQVCYRAAELPPSCTPAGVVNGGDGGAAADADAAGDGGSADDGGAADGADAAGGGDAADDGDDAGRDAAGGGDAPAGGDAAGGGAGTGGAAGAGGGAAGVGGSGGAPPPDDRTAVDGFFPPPPSILTTGPWLYTTSAPAGAWTLAGLRRDPMAHGATRVLRWTARARRQSADGVAPRGGRPLAADDVPHRAGRHPARVALGPLGRRDRGPREWHARGARIRTGRRATVTSASTPRR